jgi:Mn-dependent DtxR family transcriptional regulator
MFDQKEYIKRKDVETALNLSQPTSVMLLRRMVEKGFIKMVGTGKLVKYVREK